MKPVHKFIYDDKGRLISAPITVIVCSPATDGVTTDATTSREYALFCASCEVTVFAEDEEMTEMRCKGCNNIIGVRKHRGSFQ